MARQIFQDDGGTPAYRARQAYVVQARGLRGWWRRASPVEIYFKIVGGFVVFIITLGLLLSTLAAIFYLLTV